MINTYIGIDLSYTSPGVCIEKDDNLKFLFFSHLKKHKDFYYMKNDVEIYSTYYPEIKSDDINDRIKKYQHIWNSIDNFIKTSKVNHLESVIGIEGYSFGSTGQGMTKLTELGGIVRYGLKDFNMIEYPPKTLKLFFTGSGNATKWHMLKQFQSMNIVDLVHILGVKESKNLTVPHPIEDLVDAYAIVCKLQNRKSKIVDIINDILGTI